MADVSIVIDGKILRMRMTVGDANILRDTLTRLILKSVDDKEVIELSIEGDSVTVDTEVKKL